MQSFVPDCLGLETLQERGPGLEFWVTFVQAKGTCFDTLGSQSTGWDLLVQLFNNLYKLTGHYISFDQITISLRF